MICLLPDAVLSLAEEQRRKIACVLVMVAAADGALVREEISAIESSSGGWVSNCRTSSLLSGCNIIEPIADSIAEISSRTSAPSAAATITKTHAIFLLCSSARDSAASGNRQITLKGHSRDRNHFASKYNLQLSILEGG